MTRIFPLLGVLTAGVLLSACGGEPRREAVRELSVPSVAEPADAAPVTDPARALYVGRLDKICSRYNPQRAHALAEAEQAPDTQAAAEAYATDVSLAEAQLRDIEMASPPNADRSVITSNVIVRLRERLVLRRALRRSLLASDASAAQNERAQLDALTISLQAFARGYGFKVCGAH